MLSIGLRFAAILAVSASLGACVPETALIEAGVTQAPTPEIVPDAYVARADNGIAIPALPVEQIPQQFQRQTVYYPTELAPGTIVIDPSQKLLHYVTGNNRAIRYGIAVGRDGFQWSGEAIVSEKKLWPTWTPPKEMIARDPKLAKWEKGQPGGPTNPLGARAIYLTSNGVDYGYRIHGTPEWKSIGRNASSGCIRMINQDVIDLFGRVQGGEKVIVLTSSGQFPTGLSLPPPAPVPARAVAPKPAEPATPEPEPTPAIDDLMPPPADPAPIDLTI